MLYAARGSTWVKLMADVDTEAWVRAHAEKYFTFATEPVPVHTVWTIVGGTEFAPSDRDYVRFETSLPSGEKCRYLLSATNRILVVDLPTGPWRWLYVLRALRHVFRWELQAEGALFLHGVALTTDTHGICILGRSQSGKSALSFALARRGGWNWVTQDDISIIRRNDHWEIIGWPGSLRLRPSAFDVFPDLRAHLPLLTHPANALEASLPETESRVRLFPTEVSDLTGAKIQAQAKLSAILFLDPSAPAGAITRMSRSALRSALLSAWDVLPERRAGVAALDARLGNSLWRDLVFNPALFDIYGVPDISSLEQRLEALVIEINGWEIDRTALLAPETTAQSVADLVAKKS